MLGNPFEPERFDNHTNKQSSSTEPWTISRKSLVSQWAREPGCRTTSNGREELAGVAMTYVTIEVCNISDKTYEANYVQFEREDGMGGENVSHSAKGRGTVQRQRSQPQVRKLECTPFNTYASNPTRQFSIQYGILESEKQQRYTP